MSESEAHVGMMTHRYMDIYIPRLSLSPAIDIDIAGG